MYETNFLKSFHFRVIQFEKYHLTNNMKKPVPLHFFACLIRGTAMIKTQKNELRVRPGEIFYIPKGLTYQSHWYGENGKQVEFYSFGFANLPSDKSFTLQKINCDTAARKIFDRLCGCWADMEKSVGALYSFFGEVAGGMERSKAPRQNFMFEKAISYLTKDPQIKISDVAQKCFISESAVYLLFKRHTGKTPNAVRLEILCDKAVTLLSTTDRSVQEISDTLGFSSTSYFRKILRKHTGKTPLEIRREAYY